jgi:4-amino-4-deoxy-L-arabinose transferase-like glycosyltransferase
MVLPAIYLLYLLSPALGMKKKIGHLMVATVVVLVVALSWAAIVDTTPADQRPYVGSSQTNSVIELALGYNGIQRVTGMQFGHFNNSPPGGFSTGMMQDAPPGTPAAMDLPGGNAPGGMPSGMPGGTGGIGNEGGPAGVLRLLDQQLAGQISWMLPLAIMGFFAAIAILWKGKDEDAPQKIRHALFWGMWLLPMMCYFSIAGFFHRYYLVMMAPAIAALCGIGLTAMWSEFKNRGSKWYMLPASLAVTAAVESLIVSRYPGLSYWLIPVICIGCLGAAAALVYARYDDKNPLKRLSKPAVVCGVAALLVAPALWSLTPIIYHSEAQIPYAGPELAKTGPMDMGHGMGLTDSPGLEGFLLNNTKNEKFLAAVPSAMAATGLILDTGKPVMAVGGFIGSDPILTADKLADMVANGELRYYLMTDMPGPSQFPSISNNSTAAIPHFGGMMGNSQVADWVKAHGKLVPESEWNGGQAASHANAMGFGPGRGTFELYDLKW